MRRDSQVPMMKFAYVIIMLFLVELIHSLTWLSHLAGTPFYFAFLLSIIGFFYFFYKTWATDPGFTKASEEERKTVSFLCNVTFFFFLNKKVMAMFVSLVPGM